MKKLFSLITVFLYITMTCGVMVNLHYCMGRYQSFDLYAAQKNECGKCGMPMEKSHGCCKDEVKIVKLQDDHNTSTVSFSVKNIQVPAMIPSDFIAASPVSSHTFQRQDDHAPPEQSDQGIYLQNCVFRI
ncbi:MAG TPA: hypothetical protein VG676_01590 [Chitinophagaceae bacterium]|jgi:hypothetical protein|nr:hypothetical protein [Chitinophagaceae bacterium]